MKYFPNNIFWFLFIFLEICFLCLFSLFVAESSGNYFCLNLCIAHRESSLVFIFFSTLCLYFTFINLSICLITTLQKWHITIVFSFGNFLFNFNEFVEHSLQSVWETELDFFPEAKYEVKTETRALSTPPYTDHIVSFTSTNTLI